eukprot:1136767-Pelagomonas_calceolata.AAC.3
MGDEAEEELTLDGQLIDSARYNEIEDVQAALSGGANVDAADEQGRTGSPKQCKCLPGASVDCLLKLYGIKFEQDAVYAACTCRISCPISCKAPQPSLFHMDSLLFAELASCGVVRCSIKCQYNSWQLQLTSIHVCCPWLHAFLTTAVACSHCTPQPFTWQAQMGI